MICVIKGKSYKEIIGNTILLSFSYKYFAKFHTEKNLVAIK